LVQIDDEIHLAYISIVGATLVLNFLLIPTMSYYGSAIWIAAYGSMMIFYYLGNKYYPIPYDLKKIEGISAIDTFFSRIFYS
jgi:O-antigen/teichoic acid export membrane protein